MVLGASGKLLLLAVLRGFLLPVRLRLELLESSLMLCDDPWKVSPLRPVFNAGLSEDESVLAVVGSSRFARFRLDCTSAMAAPSPPRSEVETGILSLRGRSVVDWPRDEVRLGIRRREEPDERLRCAAVSVEDAIVSNGSELRATTCAQCVATAPEGP
jgi:hypothetical protein